MKGNGEVTPKPVLCAGQGCRDARQCLRFRMRYSGAKWASYDIERMKLKVQGRAEFCPHFEQVHQVKSHRR